MKKTIPLAIITILLIAGCVTTKPLSDEQRGRIKTIAIVNKLPPVSYQKFGTTIFNNTDRSQIETDIIEKGEAFLIMELENRGYKIVDNIEEADAQLELDPVTPSSTSGLPGLGVFVHTMFGINPGVQSQLSICFRLRDSSSRKQMVYHCPYIPGHSDIKKSHNSWDEYDDDEKSILLSRLEEIFLEEILNALQAWGL